MTFDQGTVRLYIHGTLDHSVDGLVVPMNSTRPLSFGHEGPPFNGWYYDGLIDEVRVWNVVRTANQIADGLSRLKGNKRGLVGWWRFNEGSGDVAFDASKARTDARLGSSPGPDANDPNWTTDTPPVIAN